uniref:HMG box domain-containing protein n=1 Tax=Amphilophus citrinellus TaxID=61819 RepID=A0A3Q0S294_AMPCI
MNQSLTGVVKHSVSAPEGWRHRSPSPRSRGQTRRKKHTHIHTPQNLPGKRKRQDEQEEGQLYVKKPPNAFMLFLKEQRPKVQAEMNINGSAAVNAVVGERWKSLSKQEQAKYYHQADQERMCHTQQHPNWSAHEKSNVFVFRGKRGGESAVPPAAQVRGDFWEAQ